MSEVELQCPLDPQLKYSESVNGAKVLRFNILKIDVLTMKETSGNADTITIIRDKNNLACPSVFPNFQ